MKVDLTMRILTVLTYYRPYTSGLTIYAERLARALVSRGHEVTILTMQYDTSLPRSEVIDGVKIVRVPVLFRVSKGVIAPTFGLRANIEVLKHDIVHLHLPQFDAAGVALRGRLFRKPTLITYHCDLTLPKGLFNALVNRVVDVMNDIAGRAAHRIVTYTEDYASHSPYAKKFRRKVSIVPPPVELPEATGAEIDSFRNDRLPPGGPLIGMAARFASEKGIEVLLNSFEGVREEFPGAVIVFAGQYQNVLGEDEYFELLRPRIEALQRSDSWRFLGVLSPKQMGELFPSLDLLVVPSLNSTESFGLVQVEAMMNGVPVVASNLPGVRQPVAMTGMGRIAEVGDSKSLTQEILMVLRDRDRFVRNPGQIRDRFSLNRAAEEYEKLYSSVAEEIKMNH